MVDYKNDRDTLTTTEIRDEYNNTYTNGTCGCECCHCKKIFMMLVLLILTFIAGIMVGNCAHYRYDDSYYSNFAYSDHNSLNNAKRYHRGMSPATPTTPARRINNRAYPSPQTGGFVMEVDEID